MARRLQIIHSKEPLLYAPTLEQQMERVESILSNPEQPYVLHFLEHSHVLTKGRGFEVEHMLSPEGVLREKGVEVVEVSRGGSVTYHGPGQLVVYLHIHLKELGIYLTQYLRDLEQWVIDALGEFGVEADRKEGMTGVWTNAGKICAMGVAAKKYVSYHGIGLNVQTQMEGFNWIVPCGLHGQPVASLDTLLGKEVSRNEVERSLLKHLPSWLRDLERA